ncbi:MAG TPA: STAS/SEC14 domain-containing protein [Chloroflexota bacterium]|nr:STAS/SEC14 domain-containing protein [Chloroflexota bacterium]
MSYALSWVPNGEYVANIQIEAQVSTEELFRAIEHLSPGDFADVVERVLVMRANRVATHADQSETNLLSRINNGTPVEMQKRFDELVAKREVESISPEELSELIDLTELIETRDAERLEALNALARSRGLPLADLMNSLGIVPRARV